MSESNSQKERFGVTRAANGAVTVSATVVDGNLSAKWSVKTYAGNIRYGVDEALKGARESIAALREAVGVER